MSFYDDLMASLNEVLEYQDGKPTARSHRVVVAEVPDISAIEIKELRQSLNMTQKMFACVLGVSNKTVEAWEKGTNIPSGTARRMMSLLQVDKTIPERYNLVVR